MIISYSEFAFGQNGRTELEIELQANFNTSSGKRRELLQQGSMVIGKFVGKVVSAKENNTG